MEKLLLIVIGILLIIIFVLTVKIYFLHKTTKEITEEWIIREKSFFQILHII